ncbi:MAG: hypothetical protein ACM31H_01100 [Nitrososphaerales archaeon]
MVNNSDIRNILFQKEFNTDLNLSDIIKYIKVRFSDKELMQLFELVQFALGTYTDSELINEIFNRGLEDDIN